MDRIVEWLEVVAVAVDRADVVVNPGTLVEDGFAVVEDSLPGPAQVLAPWYMSLPVGKRYMLYQHCK